MYGVDPKVWRRMSWGDRARAGIQFHRELAEREYQEWRQSAMRDTLAKWERPNSPAN